MDDARLFREVIGRHYTGAGVYRVTVPRPPFGASCFMVESKGVYQLSVGEGALLSVSCTHVGSGGVEIYDGVCDASGAMVGEKKAIYKANPQTMGLWLMGAGFAKGVVVRCLGGVLDTPVYLTLSWMEL